MTVLTYSHREFFPRCHILGMIPFVQKHRQIDIILSGTRNSRHRSQRVQIFLLKSFHCHSVRRPCIMVIKIPLHIQRQVLRSQNAGMSHGCHRIQSQRLIFRLQQIVSLIHGEKDTAAADCHQEYGLCHLILPPEHPVSRRAGHQSHGNCCDGRQSSRKLDHRSQKLQQGIGFLQRIPGEIVSTYRNCHTSQNKCNLGCLIMCRILFLFPVTDSKIHNHSQ